MLGLAHRSERRCRRRRRCCRLFAKFLLLEFSLNNCTTKHTVGRVWIFVAVCVLSCVSECLFAGHGMHVNGMMLVSFVQKGKCVANGMAVDSNIRRICDVV